MIDSRVSIRFFLAGHGEYAARHWHHVPPIGAEIMLGVGRDFDFPKDKDGKAAFVVRRLVYGVEGPNDYGECVNIEIEPADAILKGEQP